MASLLNAVEVTASVAGKNLKYYSLQLEQAFYAHHRFTIVTDYEELTGAWMDDPGRMIRLIGENVNITMRHRQTGEENLFLGIITGIIHSGYHGNQNSITVSGYSPTIKLDGKPTMDSFMDRTLEQVVNEAVANSGNGGEVTVKPTFKSQLDYVAQYNESCFDFLVRLAGHFGEWFFYDGLQTRFGMKYGKDASLEYDREMTYFELAANMQAGKFKRYQYLHHDDKDIDTGAPDDVPGVRGYLKVTKDRSETIYTSEATVPLFPDVKTKKDLDDLVKAEKSRSVAGMLLIRGKTQTCKVKIGDSLRVQISDTVKGAFSHVDRFLVTKVNHFVDQDGRYHNDLEGIIDGMEVVPVPEPKLPVTGPQLATVKTNEDPKERGLVKVEFPWQKPKHKTTNWIRVQTPDAGKSDKVGNNRGFVFVPEKDDLVMIGFEFGDPSRPFVMGGIFSEKTGKGGSKNNKTKSLTTRSGATVILDDDENKGSITIKELSGNVVRLDGNGNIDITAPNTITLNAKDIKLNAGNSISVESKPGKNGGEGTIDVTAHKTMSLKTETDSFSVESQSKAISLKAKTDFSASSETASMKLQAAKDTKIESADIKVKGSATIRISSSDTDII